MESIDDEIRKAETQKDPVLKTGLQWKYINRSYSDKPGIF